MNDTVKIALLIDADNTQVAKLDDIVRTISSRGRIVLNRAYGNWQKDTLKPWNNPVKRLAIKAEQQFDYVAGKNATDIALVIDAMSLLHRNIYDIFAIAASDSDYTPLAVKLRESGAYVIGIGSKSAPKAFKNSCDEYIFIEELGNKNTITVPPDSPATEVSEANEETCDMKGEILELLKAALNQYNDEEGYVHLCTAGMFIRKTIPDFNVKSLGYSRLVRFIEAYPEMFEVKQNVGDKGVTGYTYRLVQS